MVTNIKIAIAGYSNRRAGSFLLYVLGRILTNNFRLSAFKKRLLLCYIIHLKALLLVNSKAFILIYFKVIVFKFIQTKI